MRAALAALLVVAAPAAAQVEVRAPAGTCVLPVDDGPPVAAAAAARLGARGCPASEQTAAFEVTYEGFPPEAEAAFQAAVDTWACQVESPVPIRIAATWETLAAGTLGTAGPFVLRNFDGAPARDVWYPSALADRLAGHDVNPDDPDIEASFNASFGDWHFDPQSAPGDRYDLFTVVLHEIGHGLGFIGALRVEDGRGRVGSDPAGPFAFDLQTEDALGRPLLNSGLYPAGSLRLADALTQPVRFTGAAAEAAGVSPVSLYAPGRWEPGGSYSHLDEETYRSGTPDGMMSPFVSRGEAVDAPGPATCAVMADIGWALAGACAGYVGRLGAPEAGLEVVRLGPNPVRDRTRLEIRSGLSRQIAVGVVDALGRRVRDLGTTSLTATRPYAVDLDVGSLASGVYWVVVWGGGGGPEAVAVTVVR